jgi:hypothetical protein
VTDAEVLAAATARYEAFRSLLPSVLDDLEAAIGIRRDKLAADTRVQLVAAASDTTARLVAGDANASGS